MRPRGWNVSLVVAIALFAGCGNPRPPEPPALELPQPVRDLRATRKADKVYLSWTIPQRTTEAETVLYYGPTRICRGLQPALSSCNAPAGEAPPPTTAQRQAAQTGTAPKETYIDSLPPSPSATPTAEYTYVVEVLNQAGRSAGLSNQVHVPAAPTLPPPSDFRAQLTPNSVQLSWTQIPPPSPTPGIQYEIRIYRRDLSSGQEILLTTAPGTSTQFLDQTFDWEKTYSYHATVVTEVQLSGRPCPPNASSRICETTAYVEGADTPSIQIFAHDIFPPSTPTGLQAVFSGTGQKPFIDLVWTPSTSSDLAGYNVYRREDNQAEWEKINSGLIQAPAYRDAHVQPGKKYFYSVTAVDERGNESARSEEAGESVPQP